MYEFMYVYIDNEKYEDNVLLVEYNTQLFSLEDLEKLIAEMLEENHDIDWLNDQLINYDSTVRDYISCYEYRNNKLVQVK